MSKNPRRIVEGPEEMRRAQVAEHLKQAGSKNFESVYGATTPGSFDFSNDMAQMQEELGMVGMNPEVSVPPEAPKPVTRPVVKQVARPRPTVPVQPVQAPPEEPEEVLEEESAGEELSDDPEKRLEQISTALKKMNPNAPHADILRSWKQMHGEIFITNIDDYVFIYRYLKRQEHIQLQASPRINEMLEHQVEEMLFDKCILWPQMDALRKAGLPAGAMNAIVAQIKMRSMFLDPGYVAQMTFKL